MGKLGLSQDQIQALTKHAWNDLQDTRNADATYKLLTKSKYGSGGATAWAEYAKGWTSDNAAESARKVAHLYYGHQLKNGAVKTAVDATRPPTAQAQVTKGEMPKPTEIDYGAKGLATARKMGFKDLQDMLLAHKAPLIGGGVRQW